MLPVAIGEPTGVNGGVSGEIIGGITGEDSGVSLTDGNTGGGYAGGDRDVNIDLPDVTSFGEQVFTYPRQVQTTFPSIGGVYPSERGNSGDLHPSGWYFNLKILNLRSSIFWLSAFNLPFNPEKTTCPVIVLR